MAEKRITALLRVTLALALIAGLMVSALDVRAEGDGDGKKKDEAVEEPAEGTTLVIHGGNHSTENVIDLSADGGESVSDAQGGDINTSNAGGEVIEPAAVEPVAEAPLEEAYEVPVESEQIAPVAGADVAGAGNGGVATSDASGGTLTAPLNGDGTAPVSINTGGNSGSTIEVGNVVGGDGSTAVEIYGGDTNVSTDVSVSVDGGSATADASGGNENVATILAAGGDVAVTGAVAAAGNGGEANAEAAGGSIPFGQILGGNNHGAVISIGDIYGGVSACDCGDAGDVTVKIHGGTLTASTVASSGAEGGLANADGSGGDFNVAVVAGTDAADTGDEELLQSAQTVGIAGGSVDGELDAGLVADDAGIGGVEASAAGGGDSTLIGTIGGNNRGATITLGDIAAGDNLGGGTGGDATVGIYGGDIFASSSSDGAPSYAGGNVGANIVAGDVIAGDGYWGSGGDATLLIDGGSIFAAAASPSGAFAGDNVGATILAGDTIGGDGFGGNGGDATVALEGSDISATGFGLEIEAPFDTGAPIIDLPWDAAGASAGNGGIADASADSGSATIGAVYAGNNVGSVITVGDTIGGDGYHGDGGDATVLVSGTDITTSFIASVSVDGGVAGASALGGNDNAADVPGGGLLGGASAAAGSGGFAGSSANGGNIQVGDIYLGGNHGGIITVGDTVGGEGYYGDGGDATVALDGGSITAAVILDLSANGGAAFSSADGGDENNATVLGDGTADLGAFAGAGGVALAEANGGTIVVGDIFVGGNTGAVMSVGDTVGGYGGHGGTGGDATVAVNGTSILSVIMLDLEANGGTALATADGGDRNLALLDATDAATLTGVDVLAGVGGLASAQANGGTIIVGDLFAGGNVGTVAAFGDTVGGDGWYGKQGESQVFLRDGGSIVSMVEIVASANGGEALASADGGDDNVAVLIADATTTIGDAPRAGNGGTVVSAANGGLIEIGNVTSGFNMGTVFIGPETADIDVEKDKDPKAPVCKVDCKPGKEKPGKVITGKPGKPSKVTTGGTAKPMKVVVAKGGKANGGKVRAAKVRKAKNVKGLPSTGTGSAMVAEFGASTEAALMLGAVVAVAGVGFGLRRRDAFSVVRRG